MIYFPYAEPLAVAQCLTEADLKNQIKEIKQMVAEGSKGQYEWLDRCSVCFEHFLKGDIISAQWWNYHASLVQPSTINEASCDRDKGLLYQKSPKKYAQFHDYSDQPATKAKKSSK